MRTLLILLLTVATAPAAFACREPLSETYTFFSELPRKLEAKSVVAKIKIMATEIDKNHDKITSAKVVSAIKGIKKGATIKIVSDSSSCNHDPDIRANQEYYIAGAIGTDGTFRGTWKQRELNEQK